VQLASNALAFVGASKPRTQLTFTLQLLGALAERLRLQLMLVHGTAGQPHCHSANQLGSPRGRGQEAWAFNGSVPGPELRVNQGDRVQVTLINQLPDSTTIHWHGVQLPNAEDGVAGVTQDAVASGGTYTYEFVAREAGTYWYHSHQQTEQQLPRGLFGPLVVLPSGSQATQQRDYTLTLHGSSGQVSINGVADNLQLDTLPGETVRLRLINAVDPGMDGGPEAPVLVGASFEVVALDGRDLSVPDALGPTRIPLGMGQRADLVFTMLASGSVRLINSELIGETSPVQNVLFGSQQRRLAWSRLARAMRLPSMRARLRSLMRSTTVRHPSIRSPRPRRT